VTRAGHVETSTLYCDDNLHRLRGFPAGCIDLIYLDPPFFSNRTYEVVWGDEAEVRSFEDRWEGGIDQYVGWMRPRVEEMHRVLRAGGSLFLHCDWHASHHLRVLLDRVFGDGRAGFRNEIVWHYGGRGAKAIANQYPRNHDVLLWYSKGDGWTYNRQHTETLLTTTQARSAGYRTDEAGRWFKTAPRGDYTDDSVAALEREGRIHRTRTGNVRVKYFLEQRGGQVVERKLVGDVWNDIADAMHMPVEERLGYPTQKPLALLRRVIETASNPGDVVLDPFCGCGTAVAAAHETNRRWVGIDICPTAIGVMRRRLDKVGVAPRIVGLPTTEAELRFLRPYEFENWVIQQVSGTPSPRRSGDMGIAGYTFMYQEPIQVERSDKIDRPVVDSFETAVERSGKGVGYIVAFGFTRGAYEEAARARRAGKATVVLVTVADLLHAREAMTRPGAPVPPDRARPAGTTDMMRLLSALQRSVDERPLPEPRPKTARPAPEALIASDLAVA
jgi:DNA modification methylase